jgi:hypothetical protein
MTTVQPPDRAADGTIIACAPTPTARPSRHPQAGLVRSGRRPVGDELVDRDAQLGTDGVVAKIEDGKVGVEDA